ncbi:hypothetical protein BHM03_00044617 [Ensete ventricosum]|uniref:Uncharacterized protein n=1 Tax=Ensete ventricosum TaxID=4639 RepID=A0A426X0L6_ENSVE|nr:hypothetical protein B296_00052654 [Ensete ventricosum]RZS13066.1 hypothetical protein BHM03_00044617 [Ensete ventricosum]
MTTAVLHYSDSVEVPATPLPGGPTVEVDWSLNQARSFRYIPALTSAHTDF